MESSWVKGWDLNPMTGILIKRGEDTETREGADVTMGAEAWQSQAGTHPGLQEPLTPGERHRTDPPTEP